MSLKNKSRVTRGGGGGRAGLCVPDVGLSVLNYADSAEASGTHYSSVLGTQRNLRIRSPWLRTLRRLLLPDSCGEGLGF